MAADQERNRKIAEALGATVKEWQTSLTPASFVQTLHTEVWLDGKLLYHAWRDSDSNVINIVVSWPDFSLPEWQRKIQEWVRELSPSGAVHYHYIPGTGHIVSTEGCDNWIYVPTVNFKETMREAYEDCLLRLAERQVKHD